MPSSRPSRTCLEWRWGPSERAWRGNEHRLAHTKRQSGEEVGFQSAYMPGGPNIAVSLDNRTLLVHHKR